MFRACEAKSEPNCARPSRSAPRSILAGAILAGALIAAVAVLAPSTGSAQSRSQSFRICVVDEDKFQIKDVDLYLSSRPGHFVPIEPADEESFQECSGGKQFWRFTVTNSLDTPGNRAILEFHFKTKPDGEEGTGRPPIDSTFSLPLRLLALNKIGEPDNRIDIWIPASIPEKLGTSYLDTLEQMSAPHHIKKLMHAAILYDRLVKLYGPTSDVAQRVANIMMNASSELIAQNRDTESLFDMPEFVIKTIEESFGKHNYWERIVRRFEESHSAPIVKADQLIRELARTGQCKPARDVLNAISAYVGEEDYLLADASVPETHLKDLGVMIEQQCRIDG